MGPGGQRQRRGGDHAGAVAGVFSYIIPVNTTCRTGKWQHDLHQVKSDAIRLSHIERSHFVQYGIQECTRTDRFNPVRVCIYFCKVFSAGTEQETDSGYKGRYFMECFHQFIF